MSNRQASAQNTAIVRIVDGWSVTLDGEEPTVRDEELGTRLGFGRSRDIRKLIERLTADGILNDSDVRATVSQTTERGGRPGMRYRLTETGALLVIGRSNTKIANAITRQVVQVFIAVRRGQLPTPQQVPVPVIPNSPTLGDKLYRSDVKARCAMTSKCTGASVQRVHGWLRKLFKISGIYQINGAFYDQVCNYLESWALGRVALPSVVPRLLKSVPESAQRLLQFPDVKQP